MQYTGDQTFFNLFQIFILPQNDQEDITVLDHKVRRRDQDYIFKNDFFNNDHLYTKTVSKIQLPNGFSKKL